SDQRTRLAEIGTDLDAMEMIDISVLSTLQTGGNPGPISSLLKLRWSEIRQSIAELAMDAIGDEALRWFPERPLYETSQLPPEDEEMAAMVPRYLNSRAFTIMGGTSEIQTNILAKSLVGL
ncbi:MAG: acyl-CoA dehydrogenase family protein, partial [Xanthobacteraceae bacterium]